MADTGWLTASAFTDDTFCGTPGASSSGGWQNETNAYADGGSFARVEGNGKTSGITRTVHYSGFGASVPSGATIDGIELRIDRWNNRITGSPNFSDNVVRIQKTDTDGSANNKASGSSWPLSEGTATYGGASDLWGLTLTDSDVNASTFGMHLCVYYTAFGGTRAYAQVDYVSIKVYYTEASGSEVTGALQASASVVAGVVSIEFGVSGALASQAAAVVGSAVLELVASGVLTAGASVVVGSAGLELPVVGACEAGSASVSGELEASKVATGAYGAQASVVSASGSLSLDAIGAFAAQGSTVAGSATIALACVAAFLSQDAVVAAALHKVIDTTGSLLAQSAVISASGQNGRWLTVAHTYLQASFVWLVEIDWPSGDRRYSSRDITLDGTHGYHGRLVSLDEVIWGVDGALSTATFTLENSDFVESIESLWTDANPPENCDCRIYLHFIGETLAQRILVLQGQISEVRDIDEERGTISFVATVSAGITKQIGKEINTTDFPDAPSESLGKMQPIPFGTVADLELIPVTTIAKSTTAGTVLADDTTITLEDATDFPSSGTGRIGEDTFTWSGKTGDNLTGVSGLTTNYATGVQVTEVGNATYLAGQPAINSIANVFAFRGERKSAVPVADYTESLSGPSTITFPNGIPLVKVPSGSTAFSQVQMDEEGETNTAGAPEQAAGDAPGWGPRNYASIDGSRLVLDLVQVDAAEEIGEPVRVWAVAEFDNRDLALIDGDGDSVEFRFRPARAKSLHGWGDNSPYGTLGQGDTTHRSSPVQITTDIDWLQVDGGNEFWLGVKRGGTLWGCGRNASGYELGLATTVSHSSPVQIGVEEDWTRVVVGTTGGSGTRGTDLFVWGLNSSGQLGLDDTTTRSSPVQVPGEWSLDGVKSYSSNNRFGFKGTALFGWGSNSSGTIGDDSTTDRSSPVQVGSAGEYTKVANGDAHVIAIASDGSLYSWGSASDGRLGNGTTTPNISSPVQIDAGTWSDVSAGPSHSAAINSAGELFTWGNGADGRLGHGNTTSLSSPVQVAGTWEEVVCRSSGTYARKSDGSVWAWGAGTVGENGNDATSSVSSPVQVATSRVPLQLAAGVSFGLFLENDQTNDISDSLIPGGNLPSDLKNRAELVLSRAYDDEHDHAVQSGSESTVTEAPGTATERFSTFGGIDKPYSGSIWEGFSGASSWTNQNNVLSGDTTSATIDSVSGSTLGPLAGIKCDGWSYTETGGKSMTKFRAKVIWGADGDAYTGGLRLYFYVDGALYDTIDHSDGGDTKQTQYTDYYSTSDPSKVNNCVVFVYNNHKNNAAQDGDGFRVFQVALEVVEVDDDGGASVESPLEWSRTHLMDITAGVDAFSDFTNAILLLTLDNASSTRTLKVIRLFFLVEFAPFVYEPADRVLASVTGLVTDGGPIDILRQIITNSALLGLASSFYNASKLSAAETELDALSYRLDFAITSKIQADELIAKVCRQSRLRWWWKDDALCVGFRQDIANMGSPVKVYRDNDVVRGSIVRERTILGEIVSKLEVRYNFSYEKRRLVSNVIETGTAAASVGTREGVIDLDLVSDDTTAGVYAAWHVEVTEKSRIRMKLGLYLPGLDVDLSQIVSLVSKRFTYSKMEIVEMRIVDGHRIEVTVMVWDAIT